MDTRYWSDLAGRLTSGWRAYALLVLAVILVFGKTAAFRLTGFDDNDQVGQAVLRAHDPRAYLNTLRENTFPDRQDIFFYRPVLSLSFLINARFAGSAPGPYHAVNVGLHAAAACVVFCLFVALGIPRGESILLAALWALHPVIAPVAAWIPGRNDSLLALTAIPCLLFFVRWINSGGPWAATGSVFFYALALFTKETTLALPGMAVAFTFMRRRTAPPARAIALMAGLTAAVSLVYLYARITAKAYSGANFPPAGDLLTNIGPGLTALVVYFGKVVTLRGLTGLPFLPDQAIWPGIAVCIAGAAWWFIFRKSIDNRAAAAGIAWFLLLTVPTVVLSRDYHLEHRLYLPLIGLLISVRALAMPVIAHPARRLLWVVLCTVCAAASFNRVDEFMNRYTFWSAAARLNPHCTSTRVNLGTVLMNTRGEIPRAEREFQAALALVPHNPIALQNIAVIRFRSGRFDEAFGMLSDLLRRPQPPGIREQIRFSLAGMLYERGRTDEAAALWRGIAQAPGESRREAMRNLAAHEMLSGSARDTTCQDTAQRLYAITAADLRAFTGRPDWFHRGSGNE